MQLVLALVVVLCLVSVGSAQQSICGKYAQALFGNDNVTTEIQLIQTVLNATIALLLADPITSPWFNGVNNGINFTDPSQATNLYLLQDHLYLFFGHALNCSLWNPTVANNNMQAIHDFNGAGQKFITKAAFERFNQLVTKVLSTSGVAQADIITVGSFLDGFRTGSGTATNQICQDPGCPTPPYGVSVSSLTTGNTNAFLPAYYSVPNGGTLIFTSEPNIALGSHTVTLVNAPLNSSAACGVPGSGFNNNPFTGNFTTPPFTTAGINWIQCSVHCSLTPNMWMVADVAAATTVPTAPVTTAPPTSPAPVAPVAPTKAPSLAATNVLPVFLMALLCVLAVLL